MQRLRVNLVQTDMERLEQLTVGADRPLALRARIVLLANQGQPDAQIAMLLRISRKTVWRWRTRFAESGFAAIERQKPRSGRKPTMRNEWAGRIIETTLSVQPHDGARWTTRRLAEALGISRGMVHRVWRDFGITPPKLARIHSDVERSPAQRTA